MPAPTVRATGMTKFDYKIVDLKGDAPSLEKRLDAYGLEGWELVSVLELSSGLFRAFMRKTTLGGPTMLGGV